MMHTAGIVRCCNPTSGAKLDKTWFVFDNQRLLAMTPTLWVVLLNFLLMPAASIAQDPVSAEFDAAVSTEFKRTHCLATLVLNVRVN